MTARSWYLRKFGWIPRPVRQIIVLVIGGTVLLIALLGMVLPVMPGFIFLPLALAILAAEFAWAARWLLKIRRTARDAFELEAEKAPWQTRWLFRGRDRVSACWRWVCGKPQLAKPQTGPGCGERRTAEPLSGGAGGDRACPISPPRPSGHVPNIGPKLRAVSPE